MKTKDKVLFYGLICLGSYLLHIIFAESDWRILISLPMLFSSILFGAYLKEAEIEK